MKTGKKRLNPPDSPFFALTETTESVRSRIRAANRRDLARAGARSVLWGIHEFLAWISESFEPDVHNRTLI